MCRVAGRWRVAANNILSAIQLLGSQWKPSAFELGVPCASAGDESAWDRRQSRRRGWGAVPFARAPAWASQPGSSPRPKCHQAAPRPPDALQRAGQGRRGSLRARTRGACVCGLSQRALFAGGCPGRGLSWPQPRVVAGTPAGADPRRISFEQALLAGSYLVTCALGSLAIGQVTPGKGSRARHRAQLIPNLNGRAKQYPFFICSRQATRPGIDARITVEPLGGWGRGAQCSLSRRAMGARASRSPPVCL
jgi:hypothetical protein